MRTKTSDTERLIAGLLKGDRRAHIEAMRLYGRLVGSIAGSMTSDARDAEELTQDAFIKAFRTIGSFDGRKAALSTWLARITYHAAVDHLRRKGVRPAEDITDSPPEPPEEPDNMLTELLDNALELISAEERTATFTAETKSSGILRVRSYMKEEDVTRGKVMYISCSNIEPIWNKIYETYMGFMDYDADISLTYMRKNRMLTLYSPSSHILNAACMKDNIIYLFTGTYSGTNPYLPSNWTHSVRINKDAMSSEGK